MSNVMKTLGQNLTRIRVEKGLTRKELSGLLGMSELILAGIEEGGVDVETGFIYRAAAVLEVGIENLICSDQTRNQLLDQIKNRLDTCSEKELVLVFEYLSSILKK